MYYYLYVRMVYGSLAIIEGYDEAIKFLEEEGDNIAYIIKEVITDKKKF